MFRYLETKQEVEAHIASLTKADYIVLDVETTSKDAWKANLVDIQLSDLDPNKAVMFPAEFKDCLLKLPDKILVGQNFKYDLTVLYRHGVDLRAYKWRDTLHMHHLYNENSEHSLGSILEDLYEGKYAEYKDGFWQKYENYQDAPIDERLAYGCRDIVYTGLIYRDLSSKLNPDLVEHTHRLATALLDTEIHGIRVDTNKLIELGTELLDGTAELEAKMRDLVADEIEIIELELYAKELLKRKTPKGKANVKRPEFSFASSKQMGILLYEKLKIPVRKTKKGSYATDKDTIDEISHLHPVCQYISKRNRYHTYYSTFIKGVSDRLIGDRIHPSFNVSGTKTGRISHSNPNMGNMPAKDPEWNKIRNIFLPEEGEVIVKGDYSQLEVCIEAHYTGDKQLLRIINDSISKHDITNEELGLNNRGTAKTLNFAMQYWCQPFKVKQLLGCSDARAEEIWKRYWQVYSGPKALKDKTDRMVDTGTPVRSLYGRERHFEQGPRPPYSKAYRQAYNALIQGSGGDITSEAFYIMAEWLKETGYGRAGWTIHDELVIFAKVEYAKIVLDKLEEVMVQVGIDRKLTVPLSVEAEGNLEYWRK